MSSDRLHLSLSTVEDLANECGRFHDFPFHLGAQSYDTAQRTWTGYFIRGSADPSRVVTTRRPWLVKVTEFPIIETAVAIRHVTEAEIQDRAQVGVYTFRQVHRTATGCRFEFHQDCDIYIDIDGPFEAEIRDVRELTRARGRITSLGFLDFGIEVRDVSPPSGTGRLT